jgi:histidinol dehydrogenase
VKILKVTPKSEEIERLCSRSVAPSPEIHKKVLSILEDVKKNGVSAALRYAKEFDGLNASSLKISAKTVTSAASKTPESLRSAIRSAIRNVRDFHKKQMEKSWDFVTKEGSLLGQRIRPMRRVGLYVPGGAGVYPSTVIMNAVPALVAGVSEIVVVTPAKGGLNPAVAFVLQELGITEIYHIGGAQAVALLAYGGKGITPVDKIVGPGNVFAAVAKKEVFGTVDIDMIAGPSEVLVMADASSDPDFVAADLLAQAEHGSGFEAAICITDSMEVAKDVLACVEAQVEVSPRKELLEKSLARFGRILVVKDWETGVAIANRIAPEHLEVMTRNAEKLAERLDNAGAIFIGPWSSEPVGDYFAGPNHVLPTNGTARFSSPLGVYDFLKRTSIIRYSQKAMLKNAKAIAEFASAESFYHHAQAVLKRL